MGLKRLNTHSLQFDSQTCLFTNSPSSLWQKMKYSVVDMTNKIKLFSTCLPVKNSVLTTIRESRLPFVSRRRNILKTVKIHFEGSLQSDLRVKRTLPQDDDLKVSICRRLKVSQASACGSQNYENSLEYHDTYLQSKCSDPLINFSPFLH